MEASVFRVRCSACLSFQANRVAIRRRIAIGVSRQPLQPSFVRRGRSCACFSSFPSRTPSLPPPSPPCVSSCSSIRAHLPSPLVRRRDSPSWPSRVCRAPCTNESCSSDPTSLALVSTRTNPGSIRRTRPFEPEPIRVQTRVRRRWRPTLSTSHSAVMTTSGRGRGTCVAHLERNEADAWRWEAHVQLCMHPQLRRGANEMGSTRRRSCDAPRGSASGPRRLQKKKKWQGVPIDGSHGWYLHAAGRGTSCHRHGRMRAGPPPCVVQRNRKPSKRETRNGKSKACHDVARKKGRASILRDVAHIHTVVGDPPSTALAFECVIPARATRPRERHTVASRCVKQQRSVLVQCCRPSALLVVLLRFQLVSKKRWSWSGEPHRRQRLVIGGAGRIHAPSRKDPLHRNC